MSRQLVRAIQAWVIWSASATLLSFHEPSHLDPRFDSPEALLKTYWAAVGEQDAETSAACYQDPAVAWPVVGQLFFLPPSQQVSICSLSGRFRSDDQAIFRYVVQVVSADQSDTLCFKVETNLVRTPAGWRIWEHEEFHLPNWKMTLHHCVI